jgi:hypothetical protein
MNKIDVEKAKQVLLERIVSIAANDLQESPQPFAQAYKTLVEATIYEEDFLAQVRGHTTGN